MPDPAKSRRYLTSSVSATMLTEVPTDKCPIRNLVEFESLKVDRPFAVDGHWALVQNIPAQVCDACGETTYAEPDATRIQQVLAGVETPVDFCRVPLFDFGRPFSSAAEPKMKPHRRLHSAPKPKSTDAA